MDAVLSLHQDAKAIAAGLHRSVDSLQQARQRDARLGAVGLDAECLVEAMEAMQRLEDLRRQKQVAALQPIDVDLLLLNRSLDALSDAILRVVPFVAAVLDAVPLLRVARLGSDARRFMDQVSPLPFSGI